MREILSGEIIEKIAQMCIRSNCYLNTDIRRAIENATETESSPVGKNILMSLLENASISEAEEVPICQDTGMAIVFLSIGQDVHVVGGDLYDSVNEGVRRGYESGYLRKSVVADPLRRSNTGDNTPAVIHTEVVPGDKIRITIAPKGFGSENMSAVKMLKPSDGREGVIDFVLGTVKKAGSNPCPPIVAGVGIGGSMEKAAIMAKKALLRGIDEHNGNEYYQEMEEELLEKINGLGIGPQGLGGSTTALGVNIEVFPTHIAGLPVAVNISCHVTRHSTAII